VWICPHCTSTWVCLVLSCRVFAFVFPLFFRSSPSLLITFLSILPHLPCSILRTSLSFSSFLIHDTIAFLHLFFSPLPFVSLAFPYSSQTLHHSSSPHPTFPFFLLFFPLSLFRLLLPFPLFLLPFLLLITDDKLHRSKWPFVLVYSDALPKNAANKILRIRYAER
jgi:hypothetical protein